MPDLHTTLARARERAHYTQDDVAAALGVTRAMVSYWESGSRTPNDRQLTALARLYRRQLRDLLLGKDADEQVPDLAGLMLRSEGQIDQTATLGIHEFIRFLYLYNELSELLDVPVRGMAESPFVNRSEFKKKEDVRRKAEDVRSHLRLGVGPISDMDVICQMLGVTLYRAPMGYDLSRSPSGAFLNHPDIGFSILVNLDMTPGRRRFTVAHELAHALFHSDRDDCVISHGRGSMEGFADAFAGEFLMPAEGVRRFMEHVGLPSMITDASDAVHIQRYFNVSWVVALFRLKSMKVMSAETFQRLRSEVRPVLLARSLGYRIGPEEIAQDTSMWITRRFPRRFLRMLVLAVREEVMSVPSAASFAGLSIPDVTQIMGLMSGSDDSEAEELKRVETEYKEFEDSNVITRSEKIRPKRVEPEYKELEDVNVF